VEGRGVNALVLVGFMGAGKSSGARALAAELGTEAVDSDRLVENRLGESIESYFDREGEAASRAREEEVVLELLGDGGPQVIALGGGAVGSESVREALAPHTVVHLEVPPEEAWRRASNQGRPLARDRGRFAALHAERSALYESVADAIVPPGEREAIRRVLPALEALRRAPAGTRMVWSGGAPPPALHSDPPRTPVAEYPVFAGEGLVGSGFFYPEQGRRFVVTDENVASAVPFGGAEESIVVAPGEGSKTLASAEEVLRRLARAGAERGDLLVALGGGVAGDLGGLCAALYQRGMRHVQVPTSLVAQVDSAYGGKTGVDLPEGKNYAGAYHQPSAVLTDPALLATLPAEEAAAGYVEVVKTALIAGGPLWARVRRGGEVDTDTILGCLRTKLAVVAEDERDGGRRQVLNLGHTVGHAIESATGYRRYRHGEAVGIGLLAALRLAGRDVLRAEVTELFSARGLPLAFGGASVDEVLSHIERDKKRAGGEVPFVLLDAPGEVSHGHAVDPDDLRAAVEEVHAG